MHPTFTNLTSALIMILFMICQDHTSTFSSPESIAPSLFSPAKITPSHLGQCVSVCLVRAGKVGLKLWPPDLLQLQASFGQLQGGCMHACMRAMPALFLSVPSGMRMSCPALASNARVCIYCPCIQWHLIRFMLGCASNGPCICRQGAHESSSATCHNARHAHTLCMGEDHVMHDVHIVMMQEEIDQLHAASYNVKQGQACYAVELLLQSIMYPPCSASALTSSLTSVLGVP